MKVKEAMHKNVQWCEPTTSVATLANIMKAEDIGAIPIGENDKLIGMVTDRDLAIRAVANGGNLSKKTAKDVMSKGIIYCRENEAIEDAIHLMEDNKVRRLPVINDKDRMVGILSLGDVSHAVPQNLSGELVKAVSAHHDGVIALEAG
ncbi:MAG: CBS domain-containing protein [Acidimicrobiales bacterium]|nr:CBS domain-containing protein [Hyphomonadaceae bacterium]RZV38050.1 MAG: CBS domain-containing protein [Acidimicrobiales bacterium]